MGAAWLLLRRPGWNAPEALPQHLPSIPAQLMTFDLGSRVKAGPKQLIVLRLMGPVQLRPVTYQQAGLKKPSAIGVFADKLMAPIVFNAGQFDAQGRYLGWLKSQGSYLSETRKQGWQGLLASGPNRKACQGMERMPYATLIDLQALTPEAAKSAADRYDNIVQSMMLLDDVARVRVRNSNKAACRTVVAEDDAGRLLIMASEGAITLFDLAQWLSESGLHIRRAMNLDGGMESQLAIRTEELSLTLYGKYGAESALVGARAGGAQAPLPTVVAAYPRGQNNAR